MSTDWSDDDRTVLCPVCSDTFTGPTGNGNGHLACGWIDNLRVRAEATGDALTVTTSAADGRGSEVGFRMHWEQCEHIVEFRFRFHKGDVYLAWRLVGHREDPAEMPRT